MGETPAERRRRHRAEQAGLSEDQDNALYGVGHACVFVDSPKSDLGLPECWLCHDELDEGPGIVQVKLADGTVREYPATPEGGMQMLRDTFEQARHR